VQLAAPSRTRIDRYKELSDRIEELARRINARWGTPEYEPIVLLRSHHDRIRVFTFFRAADLCYVSSLHDGMNLVAKEFVAARDDERGIVILSQFTGAARELTEALIVNPYDIQQAAEAMATALSMPANEQMERMRAMRALLSELNVYRWAGRMLVDAAQLRHRKRLSGRLTRAAEATGTDSL
jgi:trehalose 6-phosphate synthase